MTMHKATEKLHGNLFTQNRLLELRVGFNSGSTNVFLFIKE